MIPAEPLSPTWASYDEGQNEGRNFSLRLSGNQRHLRKFFRNFHYSPDQIHVLDSMWIYFVANQVHSELNRDKFVAAGFKSCENRLPSNGANREKLGYWGHSTEA